MPALVEVKLFQGKFGNARDHERCFHAGWDSLPQDDQAKLLDSHGRGEFRLRAATEYDRQELGNGVVEDCPQFAFASNKFALLFDASQKPSEAAALAALSDICDFYDRNMEERAARREANKLEVEQRKAERILEAKQSRLKDPVQRMKLLEDALLSQGVKLPYLD